MSYFLVLSTTSSLKEARKITGYLLQRKLAACVNLITGVESHYWWKNKVETSQETLMVIKTTARNYPRLQDEIKKQHSYDVPEIIAIPIEKGHPDYLRWLGHSVKA